MINNRDEFFEEMIVKAQQKIRDRYRPDTDSRKWRTAKVRSYENKSYDIEIRVLTGSPVKGYVLINHGTKTIKAFGINDKLIRTWNLNNELLLSNKRR